MEQEILKKVLDKPPKIVYTLTQCNNERIYYMASLKNKLRKKHFDTQFRMKKKMDKLAAYDLEYAQSYDINEILSGNEAYQEFVSNKNYEY